MTEDERKQRIITNDKYRTTKRSLTTVDSRMRHPDPTLRTRPKVVHLGRTPETEEKGIKKGERGGGGAKGYKGGVGRKVKDM